MEAVEEKVEAVMDQAVEAMPAKARSFLGGDWLGHPLHPVLTDLPIGFWTSSFMLDLFGGRKSRRASAAFVGLGVAAAAPTVAAGLVEFEKIGTDDDKRKTAVVHTVSNTIGTILYLWSFLLRLRGKRGRGILVALLGASAVTVGGYIGGELAYGKSDDEEKPTPLRVAV
ncbi:MAG: hypothetical protein QOG90_2043 [Actinomycetota bacterium]